MCICFCMLNQKTAYEVRISDWRSDVGSSGLKPPPLQGECWGGDGVPARRGGVEETQPHLNPPLEGEDFRAKPPPLKGSTPRQEAFDRCPTPHPCSSNWAPKNCRSILIVLFRVRDCSIV